MSMEKDNEEKDKNEEEEQKYDREVYAPFAEQIVAKLSADPVKNAGRINSFSRIVEILKSTNARKKLRDAARGHVKRVYDVYQIPTSLGTGEEQTSGPNVSVKTEVQENDHKNYEAHQSENQATSTSSADANSQIGSPKVACDVPDSRTSVDCGVPTDYPKTEAVGDSTPSCGNLETQEDVANIEKKLSCVTMFKTSGTSVAANSSSLNHCEEDTSTSAVTQIEFKANLNIVKNVQEQLSSISVNDANSSTVAVTESVGEESPVSSCTDLTTNKPIASTLPHDESAGVDQEASNAKKIDENGVANFAAAADEITISRSRRNTNASDSSATDTRSPDGSEVAGNSNAEARKWATPEKIDIGSCSGRATPDTDDCITSPKQRDAEQKSSKRAKRTRTRLPTLNLMEWKFVAVDVSPVQGSAMSANEQSTVSRLDPRINRLLPRDNLPPRSSTIQIPKKVQRLEITNELLQREIFNVFPKQEILNELPCQENPNELPCQEISNDLTCKKISKELPRQESPKDQSHNEVSSDTLETSGSNALPQVNLGLSDFDLSSLLSWAKDKVDRGEQILVAAPFASTSEPAITHPDPDSRPADHNRPSTSSTAQNRSDSSLLMSNSKKPTNDDDDDDEEVSVYWENRPFHLIHQDVKPVLPKILKKIILKPEPVSSSAQPPNGPSSFPPGNHLLPGSAAEPFTIEDEGRPKSGPRIAYLKSHDRYKEIQIDWEERDKVGKAEEIEKRREREAQEDARWREKKLERERKLREDKERRQREEEKRQREEEKEQARRREEELERRIKSLEQERSRSVGVGVMNPNMALPNQYQQVQAMNMNVSMVGPNIVMQHHNQFQQQPQMLVPYPGMSPMLPIPFGVPISAGPVVINHSMAQVAPGLNQMGQTHGLTRPNLMPVQQPAGAMLPAQLAANRSKFATSAAFSNSYNPASAASSPVARPNNMPTHGCSANSSQEATGPLASCQHCQYKGNSLDLISHHVNRHPKICPPVRLSIRDLRDAENALATATKKPARRETGVSCLDSFDWIPAGGIFMDEQSCKLCTFKSKIRAQFISHMQMHREEELAKMPKTAPPVAFHCWFCDETSTEINVFRTHVTSHTGEYTSKCSACPYMGPTGKNVKDHMLSTHPRKPVAVIPTSKKVVVEGLVLEGFGCSKCGFVQLSMDKVSAHASQRHSNFNVKVLKISMVRPSDRPRTIPLDRGPTSSKPSRESQGVTKPPQPQMSPLPRRAPPVKVRGDPRTALDRATVKDLATPPSRVKASAHTSTGTSPYSLRSPTKGVSKPNATPTPWHPETGLADNLRTFSIPKKAVMKPLPEVLAAFMPTMPMPLADKSPERAPNRSETFLADKLPAHQQEHTPDRYETTSPAADATALPKLGQRPKEAVIVQDTSQFASNIIIKSEGEAVSCLSMELEIGETTSADPVNNDVGVDGFDAAVTGVNVKSEMGDDAQCESDDSNDTLEMNLEHPNDGDAATSPESGTNKEGPIPSIADTISKLQAQLHQESAEPKAPPSSSDEPASIFYTNASSQQIRLSSHRLRDWNERRKVLVCGCLFAARSTEAFVRHREHWHKGEKRITCPECSAKLDSAADYSDHLWKTCPRADARVYACSVQPLCRFTTSSQLHFITHLKEEHAGVEWLPCYWCSKQYTTSDCLAAHLHNQCAIKLPMLSKLQDSAAAMTAAELSALDRGEASSPEEPAPPHLEVVYRCYIPGCPHESLEREVFIDHVQVDHPECKIHVCFQCSSKFSCIYELVLHAEKLHREPSCGVSDFAGLDSTSTSRETTTRADAGTADSSGTKSTSDVVCRRSSKEMAVEKRSQPIRMPVPARIIIPKPKPLSVDLPTPASDLQPATTADPAPDIAPVPASALAPVPSLIVNGPPQDETTRGYLWCSSQRMKTQDLIRNLSLILEVMNTSKMDQVVHREYLAKWRNNYGRKGRLVFGPRRCIDPLDFAREIKSEEAMRAVVDNREKLAHLYKCAAYNCAFTCASENKYHEHLSRDRCRIDDRLYCLYCGERHKTHVGAVSHVSQRHMFCTFQCPHCIYRAKNKMYLMLHVAFAHPEDVGDTVQLMSCPIQGSSVLEDELTDLFSLCIPVACAVDGCSFTSLDPRALLNHHREAHSDSPTTMSCFHCKESFPTDEIENHFQLHGIFNLHCRYCSYGTTVAEEVIVHMFSIHPNRKGRIVMRDYSQPPTAPTAQRAPEGSASPVQPTPQPDVVQIKNEPVDQTENVGSASRVDRAVEVPAPPSTSVGSSAQEPQAVPPPHPTASEPQSAAPHVEPNRHSCGYQPCRFSASRMRELDEHLTECSRRYSGDLLYCKQCFFTFREPASLLEHLRSHLAKVFKCGLCDYTAQLPFYMKEHLRLIHNLSFKDTKCSVRFPQSDSLSETAEYVYEPVVRKLVIRQDSASGCGLTSEVLPANQAAANRVPEDLVVHSVDDIPTQSIFVHPVRCGHCDYANKVRRNLIRHMEQCKRDRAVAACRPAVEDDVVEADATFEAAEMPSDAMNDDEAARTPSWYPHQVPEYVDEKEPIRCRIGDCIRLESSWAFYEEHIVTAHPDVLRLPCPHCGAKFSIISDLNLHIKLHGPNLYRCGYCLYHHYFRNLITGHCLQAHPGVPKLVRVIREARRDSMTTDASDTSTLGSSLLEESADDDAPGPLEFSCPFCDGAFKTPSQSIMREHMIKETDLESYECNHCDYKGTSSTAVQLHFATVHEDQMPDFRITIDPNREKLLDHTLNGMVEKLRQEERSRKSIRTSGAVDSRVGDGGDISNGRDESEEARACVYACPKCKQFSHPNRGVCRTHILGHLRKCYLCSAQFSRLHHLKRHFKSAHPKQKFVSPEENDEHIETFVDWVLKLIEDDQNTYGDIKIPRPITLTCKKNGCQMKFNDLKKFSEHFKKTHIQGRIGPHACAAPSTAATNPGTSRAMMNLFEDQFAGGVEKTGGGNYFELCCPYCDFKHRTRANVWRHVLRHYDFKFFQCGHCSQEFLEQKDGVYHCKAQHAHQPELVIEKQRPERLEIRAVGTRAHCEVSLDQVDGACPMETNGKYQCSDCVFTTSTFLYARYHCQKRHLLTAILKVWCGDADDVPENRGGDPTEEEEEEVGEPLKECTMCHARLKGAQAFLDHVMSEHSGGDSRVAMKRKKTQARQPATKRRNNLAASVSRATTNGSGAPTDVVAYRCNICVKNFQEMGELRTHFQTFHAGEELSHEAVRRVEMYKCPKCTFATVFFKEVWQHALKKHLFPFRCGICEKLMSSSKTVAHHSRAKHKQKKPVIEKNPLFRKQRAAFMRQLKQRRSLRSQHVEADVEDSSVAAPAAEDSDDEVMIIDVQDGDQEALLRNGSGGDATSAPADPSDDGSNPASPVSAAGIASLEPERGGTSSPLLPSSRDAYSVAADSDQLSDINNSVIASTSSMTISTFSALSPPAAVRTVARKSTAAAAGGGGNRLVDVDSTHDVTVSMSSAAAVRSVAMKSTTSMESCKAAAATKPRAKRSRQQWKEPVVAWKNKRVNLEELYPGGFSFYGSQLEKVDFARLTVVTNFRGMRNAKMSGEHLCEVFNMFPVVLLTDIQSGSRPSKRRRIEAKGGGDNGSSSNHLAAEESD